MASDPPPSIIYMYSALVSPPTRPPGMTDEQYDTWIHNRLPQNPRSGNSDDGDDDGPAAVSGP